MLYTTKGRSRCLVFDYHVYTCEVLHRQNQSVQKTPFISMISPYTLRFPVRHCKYTIKINKVKYFRGKNVNQ